MNQPRKLVLIGHTGRMGFEFLSLLKADSRFHLTEALSSHALDELKNIKQVTELAALDPNNVEVVIDFSKPELTAAVASWCGRNKKQLVCGTTGLRKAEFDALTRASENVAVLWSANMSLGVAVVSQMLKALGSLHGFEFQVEELHHKRKLDKPSGTALFLQSELEKSVGAKLPEPIGIRGGGIFGIHRIWAMGEEETIVLEHTAMNRKVFARGALEAAAWLTDKKPGLYKMTDVLLKPAAT